MRLSRRLGACCAPVLLLLSGCQSTDVGPNLGAGVAGLQLADDEQRLWSRSREEEAILDRSGFRPDLPACEAYLTAVVRQLHPEPLPGGEQLKVKILADPTLNAFALPDGTIYVHTGMLARIRNEAQLATVLGHELTHTTHRHAVKNYRNVKNTSAFYATFTVGTGGVGGLLGLVGAYASISGYSQDLEREADLTGYSLLRAHGYDVRESPKVFRQLLADITRTKVKQPYFFGSHPRLEERIANFDALVSADRRAAGGRLGAEEYVAILPPILAVNAEAALQAADYEFAADCARDYLRLRPDDPRVRFLLVEVHRKRAEKDDLAEALRLGEELRDSHPDFADVHRSLGLLHLKAGRKAEAATSFRRYLQLQPTAADRSYIENFLLQCEPHI